MFSRGTERLDRHDSFISLQSDASTHSLHGHQGQSSPFLPSYLLGDSQSHNYTASTPWLLNSGTSYGSAHTAASNSGLGSMNMPGPDTLRRDIAKGNVGGPPVCGLFSNPTLQDTPHTGMSGHIRTRSSPALKKTVTPASVGLQRSAEGSQATTVQEILNHRQGMSVSSSQADPFNTQGDLNSSDVLDDTWITVFGFPPDASSFILQQFSQYGTIIKHIVSLRSLYGRAVKHYHHPLKSSFSDCVAETTSAFLCGDILGVISEATEFMFSSWSRPAEIISECNWMHIHYMTRIQAKKALSKDGRIFGGCMRIGVVPCTEKSVMEERNRHLLDATSTSTSETGGFGSHTPLRPLTAAYVATRSDYEVVRGKPVPRRDGSLVARLKEYMFGY